MPRHLAGESIEAVNSDDMAFKSDAAGVRGDRARHQMASTGTLDHRGQIRCLSQRLRLVSRVGDQHRTGIGAKDQQRRVGAGETGQVAHIDQVAYHHGVQAGGSQPDTESGPTLGMCHGR